MNIQKISILGAGSMGTAILSGLLKSGFEASQVAVTTKSQLNAEKLRDELGVTAFALDSDAQANSRSVEGADVVLLAVKPGYVLEVLGQISSSIRPDALVISVAAGITTAAMEQALGGAVAVIRSMPNTPAIVSKAVTGLAPGSLSTDSQMSLARELFETIGSVLVVDENQIDQLSTVSGSGPAYVFYFIEQFTAAAIDLGFTVEQSRMLVEQTFAGASDLLIASGKTPEELRRQVTSPNGTTMRAVEVFENADLHQLFANATQAALARAQEIASGN
ncbi:MAG: pyrroline-5-carboxylate reductase [Microbacteriaceae bacterium]